MDRKFPPISQLSDWCVTITETINSNSVTGNSRATEGVNPTLRGSHSSPDINHRLMGMPTDSHAVVLDFPGIPLITLGMPTDPKKQ